MIAQRIDCIKYNYSLDKEVQNHKTFDSHIQISEDKQSFLIINRRPLENQQYVLEADPENVTKYKFQTRIIELEEQKLRLETNDPNISVSHISKIVEKQLDQM